MSIRFTPQEITIFDSNHQPVSIPAMVGENTGFAYHYTYNLDGSRNALYTITHITSGRCLRQECQSAERAERFIERIAPITNWHASYWLSDFAIGHRNSRRMNWVLTCLYWRTVTKMTYEQWEVAK